MRVRLIAISGVLSFLAACGAGTGGGVPTLPPVPPLVLTIGDVGASRLLSQATFGATPATITSTSLLTYDLWFAAQAAASPSLALPSVTQPYTYWIPFWFNNVMFGQDQLRQRMAFALSEILVVSSANAPLQSENQAMAYYYDLLVNNALGNYRTLLEQVTLSPEMGRYLSMFRNNKPDPTTGVHADENYAREIMQLFTVGLKMLNADGTVKTDGSGNAIPAYNQSDVENLARVFTGWASAPTNNTGEYAWINDIDLLHPMVAYENHHDVDAKTIIGGVAIPAGGTTAGDLKVALDTLFNHPNTAPFISRQLIQRLVTSNPSPAYVQRVAAVFANNGSGARGDLLAVAKAILTDTEAVNPGGNTGGKLREPLLQVTGLWRAFAASDLSGERKTSDPGVLGDPMQRFAQAPLLSPTVFNFFKPDYQRAGAITDAGIVAPELQIENESSLVILANELQTLSYQYVDLLGQAHSGADDFTTDTTSASTMLHTALWEPLAVDPATLVDQLDLVLMAGQMPAAMHDSLVAYAAAIPATSLAQRVVETAELVINSPQYAVQR